MTTGAFWRALIQRLKRVNYGGDVVASHKIDQKLSVFELENPALIQFRFHHGDYYDFTHYEAKELARLLDKIVDKKNCGEAK